MGVGPRRGPAASRLGGERGGGEQKETNVSGQISTPESTITQKACGRGEKEETTLDLCHSCTRLQHWPLKDPRYLQTFSTGSWVWSFPRDGHLGKTRMLAVWNPAGFLIFT